MVGFISCRKEVSQKAPEEKHENLQTAQVDLTPKPTGFQVVAQKNLTTSTLITLRWPRSLPIPDNPQPLALCLPASQQVTARWVKASLPGTTVTIQAQPGAPRAPNAPITINQNAGLVEFAGFMRRWPVYRFKPGDDIYEAARRASQPVSGKPAAELELTLELRWPAPHVLRNSRQAGAGAQVLADSPGEKSWRRIGEKLVLNSEGLTAYEQPNPPYPTDAGDRVLGPLSLVKGNRAWARLRTKQEGLLRLDVEELIKVGFDPAQVKPEAVRLFSQGVGVPLLVAPGPNAPPGLKPGIYFWARPNSGPYSGERTYWVMVGEKLAAPRLGRDTAPTGGLPPLPVQSIQRVSLRDKDNSLETRTGSFMSIEGMEWVETKLEIGKPFNMPLSFPHFIPRGRPLNAELSFFFLPDGFVRYVNLYGARVEVDVAGVRVGTLTFANQHDVKKQITIPENRINNDQTTLTLHFFRDNPQPGGAQIMFDKVSVNYSARPILDNGRLTLTGDPQTTSTSDMIWTPLLDDAGASTDSLLALRVGNASEAQGIVPLVSRAQGAAAEKGLYWRPKTVYRIEIYQAQAIPDAPPLDPAQFDDIAAQDQVADLLIITHREFMEAARRLADFHQREGWKTRVVDIQSIYDTFGSGDLSPLNIKSFLSYTLRHWKQAPGHVLLLGDSTSDYLQVARQAVRNWVPTYTFTNGPDKWASDYWFTTVAGDDDLGDFILGRISVASRKDADAVVDKIIDYGNNANPGPWHARMAYVADNGEFIDVIDDLRKNYTPSAYGGERVYLNELPLEDNWYLDKAYVEQKNAKVSRAATQLILKTFKSGVAYLTFYGHGSPNIWTDERIWFGGDSVNSDNQHLANSGIYTFIANMTCNSGAIDYPRTPWNICITEDLMRVNKGGAIGCFVPSGPGITSIHREMSRTMRRVLFGDQLRGIGEFTMLSKARYALARQPRELLFMYILMGDPVLNLRLTARHAEFTPRKPIIEPGITHTFQLNGVEPGAGEWTAELAGESGEVYWSSDKPAKFQSGQVLCKVPVPPQTKGGTAYLRVYCWNADKKEDLAISGRLTLQRPRLTLDAFWVKPAERRPTQGKPGEAHAAGEEKKTDRVANIRLNNATTLEGRGELTVRLFTDTTSETFHRQQIKVDPGKNETFNVKLPARNPAKPLLAEAVLKLDTPPDDPTFPQVMRKQISVEIPQGWSGFLRPLSWLEAKKNNGGGVINATMVLPNKKASYEVSLRTAQDQTLSTQSLAGNVAAQPSQRSTSFTLDQQLFERLHGGTLALSELTTGTPQKVARRIDSAPVDAIPRRQPELRIVLGSVKHRPQEPTEGETIFVDLEVENTGELETEQASTELLNRPREQGGQTLPDIMRYRGARLPKIGPGRRVPVTLRWDPTHNAGPQTIYASLLPSYQSLPGGANQNLIVPLTFKVRTKAQLEVAKAHAEAKPEDIKDKRIFLKALIRNKGETDANHVMVSFYRSKLQTPDNKIGERELAKVPGLGTAEAVLPWDFDPKEFPPGTALPEPTVQVWLKGSSQRISSPSAIPPTRR